MAASNKHGPRGGSYRGRGAPDLETVKEKLSYDPTTGVFVRRKDSGTRWKAGAVAGTTDNHGYCQIGINGAHYKAHMLAWLVTYGEWPDREIDHINGLPGDNRIANLRLCAHQQNQCNRRTQRNNKVGLKGVHAIYGGAAYRSRIQVHGRTIHLGVFRTPELAHSAYIKAANALHGAFARSE